MKPSLLFFLVFLATLANGQSKRMTHWYFGNNAGIDFSSGQPVVDTFGALKSWEASSVMSDTAGNLLFYTNGDSVWNRNHTAMPNGHMLLGDESALKGIVIAPLPGSKSKYYIFTTASSLMYHIVDMDLDNGLGDVVSKNNTLSQKTTESLAGALHCNKTDYWIVARKRSDSVAHTDSIILYTYLLSGSGVTTTPNVQNMNLSGRPIPQWDHPTFSPSGNLFAYSAINSQIYLFDFDTYTGTFSFRDSIVYNLTMGDTTREVVYSTEFSPDETKLYATSWKKILHRQYASQFDLTASNITASRVILDSFEKNITQYGWDPLGRMQLGPDGRIYVSRFRSKGQNFIRDSLDVIHTPNALGAAAGYQRDFLSFYGKTTTCSLPSFMNSFSLAVIPPPDCPVSVSDIDVGGVIGFYPNPFSGSATLEINDPEFKRYKVVVTDMLGRECLSVTNPASGKIIIGGGSMTAGVYVLRVYKNNMLVKTDKILAK